MISVLQMHSRAPGHQWYWEQFAWEYTVTDALFAIAVDLAPMYLRRPDGRKMNHRDRITAMISAFGLSLTDEEREWIDLIIRLRNELIHEARWAGQHPSTKTPRRAVHAGPILHQINQRLIVSLLGFQTSFIQASWASMARFRIGA